MDRPDSGLAELLAQLAVKHVDGVAWVDHGLRVNSAERAVVNPGYVTDPVAVTEIRDHGVVIHREHQIRRLLPQDGGQPPLHLGKILVGLPLKKYGGVNQAVPLSEKGILQVLPPYAFPWDKQYLHVSLPPLSCPGSCPLPVNQRDDLPVSDLPHSVHHVLVPKGFSCPVDPTHSTVPPSERYLAKCSS